MPPFIGRAGAAHCSRFHRIVGGVSLFNLHDIPGRHKVDVSGLNRRIFWGRHARFHRHPDVSGTCVRLPGRPGRVLQRILQNARFPESLRRDPIEWIGCVDHPRRLWCPDAAPFQK